MKYITDTVRVELTVGNTTFSISTASWRVEDGVWLPERWFLEGYICKEDYEFDLYDNQQQEVYQELLEAQWAETETFVELSEADLGKCGGCRWVTNHPALPCTVNPMAFSQGCREYEV